MLKTLVCRMLPVWALMLSGLLVGCAGGDGESSGFSFASLNPANWDFRDSEYKVRRSMHFRIGDTWVIEPPVELNPISLRLYRARTDMRPPDNSTPAVIPNEVQQMTIDLGTGNGTFVDFDGRTFPLQFDADVTERFLIMARSRDWVYHDLPSPPTVAEPTYYRLVAVHPDPRQNVDAFWSLPPDPKKVHPELFGLLVHHIEHAHRLAHPISQSINLLK